MATNDNNDAAFDQLAASAGHIVGQAEMEAREVLGDEQYDKLVAYGDARASIGLIYESTVISLISQRALLIRSFKHVAYSLIALGLGWSVWYWVK